jgi:hypothetical protein
MPEPLFCCSPIKADMERKQKGKKILAPTTILS